MPTITQLPAATSVSSADELLVSQGGTSRAATVSQVLASTQPAISVASGTLLGRVSLGSGGPEPVAVGSGLSLGTGTLSANGTDHVAFPAQTVLQSTDEVILNSAGAPRRMQIGLLRGLFSAGANVTIDSAGVISAGAVASAGGGVPIASLPTSTTIAAADLVAISQGGADHAIAYQDFLGGLTIDQAQPAAAATDSDTFWTGQGSNVLVRQTLGALWNWVASHLPGYRRPVVELTTNTTLDGSVHNGAILICSQPLTLTPAPLNMGNGFFCDVINVSGGQLVFGSGIVSSSGASSLPAGQSATLRGFTYSGGTMVFANLPAAGGGASLALPGQVSGLAAGSITASSVALSWAAPTSGGVSQSYTVQYRVTGSAQWSTGLTGVASTNGTVSGLMAATSYDFEVFAVNGAGSGQPSSVVSATTAPVASATTIAWGALAPASSYSAGQSGIGVNVTATPTPPGIEFGWSSSPSTAPTAWTMASLVSGSLWGQYLNAPAAAGTYYLWAMATDGSGSLVSNAITVS
jgi:hypothetical protein